VAENYYHYDGGHCCVLQAVVSPAHAGSGSPAGTVSFSVDGVSEGAAALNYHPYNNPKPTTATLQSATTIGAGTHTIKTVYNADPSAASSCFNNWQGMTKNCFLGSSGTSSFTVLPAPTVTSLDNTSLPALGRPRFSTGFTVSSDTAKIGGFAQVDPGTTVELVMDGRVVDTAKVPLTGASGATPPELAVNVPPGQHTLMAKYLGDANELPSVSPPITVQGSGGTPTTTSPSSCTPTASKGVRVLSGDPPCLTLTTILSGGGKTGAMIEVPVGTRVTDQATLTGPNAASATGTVSYLVYDNAACSGPALVAGGGAVDGRIVHPSDPIPLTRNANGAAFGYWRVKYSGDGTNPPLFTACGEEEVLASTPGTTTRPTAGALTVAVHAYSIGFAHRVGGKVNPPVTVNVVTHEQDVEYRIDVHLESVDTGQPLTIEAAIPDGIDPASIGSISDGGSVDRARGMVVWSLPPKDVEVSFRANVLDKDKLPASLDSIVENVQAHATKPSGLPISAQGSNTLALSRLCSSPPLPYTPPSSVSGNGWSFTVVVSRKQGVVLRDVRLTNAAGDFTRYMSKSFSLPFFKVQTSDMYQAEGRVSRATGVRPGGKEHARRLAHGTAGGTDDHPGHL
jgi:hypothetical protein